MPHPTASRAVMATGIVWLAAIAAVAGIIAIAAHGSAITVLLASVASALGLGLGWVTRHEMRSGGRGRGGWWLVVAVGLSTLLGLAPQPVQATVLGVVAGFLVVCGVVMIRRYARPALKGHS